MTYFVILSQPDSKGQHAATAGNAATITRPDHTAMAANVVDVAIFTKTIAETIDMQQSARIKYDPARDRRVLYERGVKRHTQTHSVLSESNFLKGDTQWEMMMCGVALLHVLSARKAIFLARMRFFIRAPPPPPPIRSNTNFHLI